MSSSSISSDSDSEWLPAELDLSRETVKLIRKRVNTELVKWCPVAMENFTNTKTFVNLLKSKFINADFVELSVNFREDCKMFINDQLNFRVPQITQSLVSNCLNHQVPCVLQREVPRQINLDMSVFVKNKLPNVVSKEIIEQLPSILNNNQQFKNILETHSKNLNSNLEASARATLEKIVNEDHYHLVNQCYFTAFEEKGDTSIHDMKLRGEAEIERQKFIIDTKFANLTEKLDKFAELEQQVENLQSNLRYYNYLFVGVFIFVGATSIASFLSS